MSWAQRPQHLQDNYWTKRLCMKRFYVLFPDLMVAVFLFYLFPFILINVMFRYLFYEK